MAPDSLFNKISERNRTMFYIVVATMVLGMMTIMAIAAAKVPRDDKQTYIQVIGYCSGFLGILFLIVRQEKSQAKATELKKDVSEINQKLNGGLKETVKEVLDESPYPTTLEQLRDFVRDVTNCDEIAAKTARATVKEMQLAGWQPPPFQDGQALT